MPGKMAGCIDLEESNSERLYITDAAQTGLDITGNLTMQAWVKPESVPGSITFLDKYAGSNAGYRMRVHSNSWYEYSVYDGSTNEVRSDIPADTGVWRFLVGVYDGSDVIIYTDNINVVSTSHSGGISTNSEEFEIGARSNDKFFDGLVDEVRIATVPRSAQWVETEWNMMSSPSTFTSVQAVTVNYRSIGTNAGIIYQTGVASISAGAFVVTFGGGASLPTNIGQGDELVIGGETFHIDSRDSSTQVTVQVAAAAAHTGEAYTIKRAYNDPQSWETARGGDLAGENRREVGVCYNDGAFTAGVNIRDNTTNGSCYMTLTVAEGQRHNGTAASGARFDGVVDDDVIELDDPYTVVEWLEVANFSGTAVEGISIGVTGPNSLAQNLLIHDFTGAKHAVVVYPVATLRNSIIYTGPEGIRITNGSADATLENLTIWNVTDDCVDLDAGNSLTLRNCILLGAGDVDLELSGTVNYLGYTMYSTWSGQDPEGFDGNNQSPPADLDNLFVSIAASSEDLHLEPSGHNAVDTGLDLSASFTTDIDGETRSAPWDLGADQGGVTTNFRSVGTDTSVIYQTGDASIAAGATVVTFGGGASLPTNIGQGDELVIGAETFYIYSRDSNAQVTVQATAAAAHSAAAYTIKRAYNTIEAWESDRDGDLVTDNRREVGVCYDDIDFTEDNSTFPILISGSTTDAS
ncbi:MAG: LamG domain-containing protein, partial [Planctomycetota bacterium]